MDTKKKLQNRFKAIARKYQSDCLKYGYTSGDCNTLLSYFNRSGHAYKNGKTNGTGYFITFKNRDYRPEDIIQYFAIPKNNN